MPEISPWTRRSQRLAVHAIPALLESAIDAILDNAVDAVKGQGKRRIEIAVKENREAGEVFMDVSNSGPLIPDDEAARIFDLFYTTKDEGTGLGLYFAREYLTMQGGSLEYVKAQKDDLGLVKSCRYFVSAGEVLPFRSWCQLMPTRAAACSGTQ